MAHLPSAISRGAETVTRSKSQVKAFSRRVRRSSFRYGGRSLATTDDSPKRGLFFRIRVLVLFTILVLVVFYAVADVRRRKGRNDWDHTIEVAVVLLEERPVDPKAIAAFRARIPALERRLAEEALRHRPELGAPFVFRITGPLSTELRPPVVAGDGFAELAAHAYAMRKYTSAIDEAAGIDEGAFDSRIYVTIRPPLGEKTWVEGASEQGGRVGQVTVDLDETMVDVALSVVAHETFHTLGATDKYDSNGRTKVPAGLVEPTRTPLYPQPRVDVMARMRALSPHEDKLLETLDELGVGPTTATEIGWKK